MISRKDDLKTLELELAQDCETANCVAADDVTVSLSCAAKVIFHEYNDYEKWCRVTVMELLPRNKVRVLCHISRIDIDINSVFPFFFVLTKFKQVLIEKVENIRIGEFSS